MYVSSGWAMQKKSIPNMLRTGFVSFFSPQGHLVLFRWLLQRVQISQTPILSSGMLPKHLTSASTSCAGDRWVPHEPPYPVDAFRVPEMQGSLKLQAFTCRVLTVSFSFQWNPIFASRKLLFHSKTRYFVCVVVFFFFLDVWKKCWHDFSNLQLLIHCHCADKVNCYSEDQKQPVLYKHLFSCANVTGHCVHEFPHVQKHYYSKQTTLSFLTLSSVNNSESFPTFRNIVLVPCVYPETTVIVCMLLMRR